MSNIAEIGTVKELDQFLSGSSDNTVVFIDFWASWCGPCKMVEPIIEELASNEYAGKIKFLKVNIDTVPDIAKRYGIRSIPTFILMHTNGVILTKSSGALPKSMLVRKINTFVH